MKENISAELAKALLESFRHLDGFLGHNGIRLTKVDIGYCECETALTETSLNPQGVAHGGLLFSLCDAATGVAAFSMGRVTLTLNTSMSYMRVGAGKKLRAVGRCVKTGGNIIFCRAEVFDEADILIAAADVTMFRTEETTEDILKRLTEKRT